MLVSPSYSHIVLIKGAWCTIAREIFPYAFEISSCVFFVIPMTIITVLYVLIGLKLRRPRGGSGSNSEEMNVEPRNISNRHSQSHVIRMLVAVVVAFFICWAPFHAQRFMALYGRAYELERHELYQSIYQGVHYISGILYYISTCINPILYHIMSNKFRQAFKDTLSRFCGKPNSRLQHRTYSAISHRSSRMGVRNHHQFSSVRKPPETDTCFKCRRTSSICICKGISNNTGNNHHLHHHHHKNKLNHLKSFQMDQSGSESTSLTLLNSSPSEKDVVIAMTAVEKSQGPLCPSPRSQHQSSPPPLAQPSAHPTSGLRAFLSRSKKNPVGTNNNSGDFRGSSPLANGVRNEKRSWGLNNKNNNKMNLGSIRPPSDPALQSTFAVTLLDGKGNSKTAVLRPRTGSSGNAAVILATYNKTAARATSYSSVDSGKSNNTISNSSLQDMDESEYTGEELAGYMAELNHSLDSPKK
ncbi:unnamed protein product [Orchesella dallaii]|uniref:G-protein coupled receptors family 1 profile domain-containing protein n=1 Tax=Orchesella dallaii TaxID=48710 RepID=A0ABP1QLI3_9HEXA